MPSRVRGKKVHAACMSSPKAPQATQDSTEPIIIIITTKTPGIAPASESKQQQQHPPSDPITPSKERRILEHVCAMFLRFIFDCHIEHIRYYLPEEEEVVEPSHSRYILSSSHRVCVSESHNKLTSNNSTRGNRPPSERRENVVEIREKPAMEPLLLVEHGGWCLKIDAQAEGQELNLNSTPKR